MSLIRITRGVPRFNIQIGPVSQALHHNPSAILSVTDYFETLAAQAPHFHWISINEVGKSWGLHPFFATKRILDYYCLELNVPLMFVGCSAGKHRSPMATFAWLTSLEGSAKYGGTSPEDVAKEFYGKFDDDLLAKFHQDVKLGYIPAQLPQMYKTMREYPTASFRDVIGSILLTERISYIEG